MAESNSKEFQPIVASIIILTKNGERYLRSLLDGLLVQNMAKQVEIILIDSGSSDGTLRIVANYPEVRLHEIPAEEFGHGRTRNLGAKMARGEFLVYIPQDATPIGEDWLRRLLQPFSDPAVAGVYSRQLPRNEANAMEAFFLGEIYPAPPARRKLREGDQLTLSHCFFSTASGAIRAALWKTHPFREDVVVSEDQAWASEVMRAGHTIVYEPASGVLHSHQLSILGVFRRNFDAGYSIWQIYAGKTGIPLLTAIKRLAREAVFVLRQANMNDRLRFIPYEAARHLGFILGKYGEYLPKSLCMRMSSLPNFWRRRGESASANP